MQKRNFKNNNKKSNNKNNMMVLKNIPVMMIDRYGVYNEDIIADVLDVLATTKFNRLVFPLSVYKEGKKPLIIGFIKSYNAETSEFNVAIYDKYKDEVKDFKEYAIEPIFGVYEEKLTKITKLNIIDASVYNSNVDVEEVIKDAENNVETTEPVE